MTEAFAAVIIASFLVSSMTLIVALRVQAFLEREMPRRRRKSKRKEDGDAVA